MKLVTTDNVQGLINPYFQGRGFDELLRAMATGPNEIFNYELPSFLDEISSDHFGDAEKTKMRLMQIFHNKIVDEEGYPLTIPILKESSRGFYRERCFSRKNSNRLSQEGLKASLELVGFYTSDMRKMPPEIREKVSSFYDSRSGDYPSPHDSYYFSTSPFRRINIALANILRQEVSEEVKEFLNRN